MTAPRLYELLHQYKNELFVFDDVPGLLTDTELVGLLASVTDGTSTKMVQWNIKKPKAFGVPDEFQTTTRTCIIANRFPDREELEPIASRATAFLFEPSIQDVHAHAGDWFFRNVPDALVHIYNEVYLFVGEHLSYLPYIDCRWYNKAIELYHVRDWREYLYDQWFGDRATAIVCSLLNDPRYRTQEERVKVFVEQTGCCRATFYNIQGRLQPYEVPA